MIDVLSEDLIRLADLPARLPRTRKGKQVHHNSVYRWWAKGVAGIKLETIIVSGERFTSSEAVQRFFEAQTAARDAGSSSPASKSAKQQTAAARRRSDRDAQRELIRRGA